MPNATTAQNKENKCNTCGETEPKETFYKSSKTRCKTCWKKHFAKLKAKKADNGKKAV